MTTATSPALAGFHRTAHLLLAECNRPESQAWRDTRDAARTWTVAALRERLEQRAPEGTRYAQELLEEALEGLMRQAGSTFAEVAHRLPDTDAHRLVERALEQGLRPHLVALYRALPAEAVAWRYMSKTYGAHEFAQALEAGESDALRTVSDVLRVCRDVLAARARLRGEPESGTALRP